MVILNQLNLFFIKKSLLILGNSSETDLSQDSDSKIQVPMGEQQSQENLENLYLDIGPTVLFCNPNAGYFEYMKYESDWLDFYVKRGINLFLWNYRGYSESQGYPSTLALQKDGESIIDYIRSQLKVTVLGVHGESLGGMTANHLAKTKQVQFLFSDRTFSSLAEVAQYGFSKWGRFIFNLIVNWNYNSSEAYAQADCYKLLAFDPIDEVISYLASLKLGVEKHVFIKEFKSDKVSEENNMLCFKKISEFQVKRSFWKEYMYKQYGKWNQRWQWMTEDKNNEFNQVWYDRILNKEESEALFQALKRVTNVIVYIAKNNQQNPQQQNTKTTKNDSNDSAESELIRNQLKEGSNDSLYNETGNLFIYTFYCFEGSADIKNSSVNDSNTTVMLNQTMDLQPEEGLFKPNILTLQQQNPLKYNFEIPDSDKNSDKFLGFILKITEYFDSIEASSLTLNEVFTKFKEADQYPATIVSQIKNNSKFYKDFFVSVFIWGSYHPIKFIPKKKMSTLMCQKLAYGKLTQFMNKMESFVKNEKKDREASYVQKRVKFQRYLCYFQKIIHDLEYILGRFKQIRESFKKLIRSRGKIVIKISHHFKIKNSKHHLKDQKEPQNQEEEEKEEIIKKKENKCITASRYMETVNKKLGSLLPISCGHNGIFGKRENSVLEYHLQIAGFMK